MKRSKAETAETRKRIVELAAEAFKSNGIEATGVAEIMASAGLTHGGFYRHFASKDQLVAEACANTLDKLVNGYESAAERGSDALMQHLQSFMSSEVRDDRKKGCPFVAMGSELVRTDDYTRRTASDGFRQLFESIAAKIPAKDEEEATEAAIVMLCGMIGSVTMSRIVDDQKLSDRILEVAKQSITDTLTARLADTLRPIMMTETMDCDGFAS